MGDHQTYDDVRASCVAAMGEPLGAVYHALWHQVALLHIRWNSYRELFAASPQTIALLNSAAPAFFFDTERIMWEDVLLHLCRLTDPPQVGKKKRETLTLKRLPPLVADPAISADVQQLVDAADQKTQFARDWRNRRLAHTELPALFGEIHRPLENSSREHVEKALAAFRDVDEFSVPELWAGECRIREFDRGTRRSRKPTRTSAGRSRKLAATFPGCRSARLTIAARK